MNAEPLASLRPSDADSSPAPVIDTTHFRSALGQFATGVTIVTALDRDGRPVGLTASSFNSVSLEPPLVLWSLSLRSGSLDAFRDASHYAINVLAAEQLDLARRFAGRRESRFEGVAWEAGCGGAPVLGGCVAVFECRNRNRHEEGDHLIFVGQVEACRLDPRPPLLYHRGAFLLD